MSMLVDMNKAPVILRGESTAPPWIRPKNARIPLLSLLVLLLGIAPLASAQKPVGKPTGTAIYSLAEQLLKVAPKRYNGSPGHLAAETFIKDHFKPEAAKGNFLTDEFTANSPVGPQTMRNYIVKFPGKKDGIIVLASHYETNYPLKDIAFFGANDGAATTALLISLGEYFRAHPPEGFAVWLLFDDGEEAIANPPYNANQWTATNSLYGTKHLAAKWDRDGTILKIKAFIVADMIGDKSLDIDRDGNSTPWLEDILGVAAKNTGHLAALSPETLPIEDDHLPFKQRGVPVLDLIDYDYGPIDEQTGDHSFHHTIRDTIDKISAKSLQTSADLLLETIRLINAR
jgi:glutaminyl-peptide cyclotransferase